LTHRDGMRQERHCKYEPNQSVHTLVAIVIVIVIVIVAADLDRGASLAA